MSTALLGPIHRLRTQREEVSDLGDFANEGVLRGRVESTEMLIVASTLDYIVLCVNIYCIVWYLQIYLALLSA